MGSFLLVMLRSYRTNKDLAYNIYKKEQECYNQKKKKKNRFKEGSNYYTLIETVNA